MSQTPPALHFCPHQAQQIGLEEAILLSALQQFMVYRQTTEHKGRQWLELDSASLSERLPFWTLADIQRIAKNLHDHQQILLVSEPITSSEKMQYALSVSTSGATTSLPIVNASGDSNQSSTPAASGQARGQANRISPNWQPDADILAHIRQHNIPEDFAYQQLGEFITYWRDRDQIAHSWGAKFIKHVLQAWRDRESFDARRQRQERERQQRSATLPDNWQPRADIIAQLTADGVPQTFIGQCQSRFVLYQQKQGKRSDNWDMAFYSWIKDDWQKRETPYLAPKQNSAMTSDWQPEGHTLELLKGLGISRDFIKQCLAEFTHKWIEKGAVHSSWGDVFARHVSEHWRIVQAGGKRNAEPTLLANNWQPSADCLSFLQTQMGLNPEYVHQQIPEFVLYWRGRGEVRHSWDKQFVNHVKYTLNQGQNSAGQQGAGQSASTRDRSIKQDLTDLSWAD